MKIEVSVGEVVDRLSILEIKLERIGDAAKLANLRTEYDLLLEDLGRAGISRDSEDFRELKRVNLRLWEIEDQIRKKERDRAFDEEFIGLARSVYRENDKRFEIKARINRRTGSRLVEEKEYVDYDNP
ncbi:MAG: DUF6165 family protein [bacterium]|jgi:hypothetical protein